MNFLPRKLSLSFFMTSLDVPFEKKITVKLDFTQPTPIINPEQLNNLITQEEFNKIWARLKSSSETFYQRMKIIFIICLGIGVILIIVSLMSWLNVVGGKYPLFALLFIHAVLTGIITLLQIRKSCKVKRSLIRDINFQELQPKGLKLVIRSEQIQGYTKKVTTRNQLMDLIVLSQATQNDGNKYYNHSQLNNFSS